VPCRHRCRQANLRIDGKAQHDLGLVDATEGDGPVIVSVGRPAAAQSWASILATRWAPAA
jgi:hypothetical protein